MRQNAFAFAIPGFALLGESVPESRKMIEKHSEILSQKCTPRFRNRRIDSSPTESAKWTSGALRATPSSHFGREATIFVISQPKNIHPRWEPLSHL